MSDSRPDPDDLLARVQEGERRRQQGRLKIFFGYVAGVGKTYTMLESARRAQASGKDVVIGYVEPHNRPATQALVAGIEAIPTREISYKGITLRELDIDAIIRRRPEIVLIDELAHSNAEGSRHQKRWQDILEVCEAGIDVWTTLNVQHIESLNDIIGQITGVVIRETVPDQVIESADELELVDLPPEDLLERLGKGEIYLPTQAQRARDNFFHPSNLHALREIALRQAATQIHSNVEIARHLRSDAKPWATTEKLLVCVGPSPTTAKVIRTAKRMARAFDAKWVAVSVDLPGMTQSINAQEMVTQHFRLAEQLGAETNTLAGDSVVETILEYARSHNVTKIIVGKTSEPRWKRWLRKSIVDRFIDASREIDVYVIQGDVDQVSTSQPTPRPVGIRFSPIRMVGALAASLISCLIAFWLRRSHVADAEANTAMIFLAGVAFVAFRLGAGPAVVASVASTLLFDFFFVPPFGTFAVADVQYLITLMVMLLIGLLISSLTYQVRVQIENSKRRELRTSFLYELGRELSSIYGEVFLVAAASRRIEELLDAQVAIFLKRSNGIEMVVGSQNEIGKSSISMPCAQWVIDHSQVAGMGTNTLPNAVAFFVPAIGTQGCLGCLAIRAQSDSLNLSSPETRRLLDACCNQLALAVERDQLAIAASEARLQSEADRLRSTLLSSVSHDLKTPLSAIAGASQTLLASSNRSEESRRELLEMISTESLHLNRVLENILQMSRLDSGAANPNLQWHVLEEIVGSALQRTKAEMDGRAIEVSIPADLPLVLTDEIMLEQVLINLLENAAKYTPQGTSISISASIEDNQLRIRVRDRGPGIPEGLEEKVFEKFYRANPNADVGKSNGLGLAICRAIITKFGGTISVENPVGGGAEFAIRLPWSSKKPSEGLVGQ